jgi:hypothetical protein
MRMRRTHRHVNTKPTDVAVDAAPSSVAIALCHTAQWLVLAITVDAWRETERDGER